MTRMSPLDPVLAASHPSESRATANRLTLMRVRRFELRLIGVALVACWSLAGALVLLAYRPGGPLDHAADVL